MYQLLSLGPVKFCRKNPPCSHKKWPDYDVEDGMEHSGLHHHTAATALLYMWPLLLRAGEWRGLGATTGAECSQPLTLFPALCRVLQKHCSILRLRLMQQHLEICTHFLCPPLRTSLISFDNLSRGNRHGTLWVQATNSFFTNLSTVRKETLIKNGNFQCNMYLNDGPAETE